MSDPIFATVEQIKRARDEYQTDDIEIDDSEVKTSPTDEGGTWIAAWVWLSDEAQP